MEAPSTAPPRLLGKGDNQEKILGWCNAVREKMSKGPQIKGDLTYHAHGSHFLDSVLTNIGEATTFSQAQNNIERSTRIYQKTAGITYLNDTNPMFREIYAEVCMEGPSVSMESLFYKRIRELPEGWTPRQLEIIDISIEVPVQATMRVAEGHRLATILHNLIRPADLYRKECYAQGTQDALAYIATFLEPPLRTEFFIKFSDQDLLADNEDVIASLAKRFTDCVSGDSPTMKATRQQELFNGMRMTKPTSYSLFKAATSVRRTDPPFQELAVQTIAASIKVAVCTNPSVSYIVQSECMRLDSGAVPPGPGGALDWLQKLASTIAEIEPRHAQAPPPSADRQVPASSRLAKTSPKDKKRPGPGTRSNDRDKIDRTPAPPRPEGTYEDKGKVHCSHCKKRAGHTNGVWHHAGNCKSPPNSARTARVNSEETDLAFEINEDEEECKCVCLGR